MSRVKVKSRNCEWKVEDCYNKAEFYVINKSVGVTFWLCRKHYYEYVTGLAEDYTTEDELVVRRVRSGELGGPIHIVPQKLKRRVVE